jgi:predicted DNA-binding transcriptional regulator AlpA
MERLQRIIRERDLPQYVGLRRTQIAQLIARGEFPAPIKLSDSGRAKGWLEADLIVWQRSRLTKRDGATGGSGTVTADRVTATKATAS